MHKNRDIKDILKELYRLNFSVASLKEEIEYNDCLLTKVSPTLKSDIIQSSNKVTMEDLIIKKNRYTEQLRIKMYRQIQLKEFIEKILDNLGNLEWQDLIRRRYYRNQKWWEIASALNRSESHTKKLHGTILNDMRNIVKKL